MDKNSDHKKRRVTHSQEQRVLLTSRVVSLSSRSTNVTADEWLLSPHSHGYTRSRSHNGYVCHYRAPHFHPQSPQLGPPTNINQRTPCRMHRVPPPPPRPPPPTTRPPPLGKVGVKHDTGKGKSIAIKINQDIVNSKNSCDVLAVVRKSGLEAFDGVNVSTALHRLASFEQIDVAQTVESPEFSSLVGIIPLKASLLAVRNISNILWAFARLYPRYKVDSYLLDFLTCAMHSKLDQEDNLLPQNLSNALWALATLNYRPKCLLLPRIEKGVREMVNQFSPQNLSNTILAYGKLLYYPNEITMASLVEYIRKRVHSFNAQALSNTTWGLSKLDIKDPDVYNVISQAALEKLESFTPQNLALLIWALANIGYNPGERSLHILADVCCNRIDGFSAQNITNIVWGLARLGIDHSFFQLAACRAEYLLQEFNAQAFSTFIWSFASIRRRIPDTLLSLLSSHLPQSFEKWAPENLTDSIWGFAVLKQEHAQNIGRNIIPNVNKEILSRLESKMALSQFTNQNLVCYFWALGLNHENINTFEHCTCFLGIFLDRINDFEPQEIAHVCLTCARLDYFDIIVMEKIADVVIHNIREFRGPNLSTVVWSFGKLRHAHKQLFASVSLTAQENLHTFSYQDISDVLWAFSILNIEAPVLISMLAEEILSRVQVRKEEIHPLHASKILWSLSISNTIDERLWDLIIHSIDFDSLKDERMEICSQVFQSHLILQARRKCKESFEITEPARAACEQAWRITSKKAMISDFHMKVSQALDQIGEKHIVGYLTADGDCCIDIAFPLEKIAMEIGEPNHFTRANDCLGDILARNDILRTRGWHVVSIPFFAWTLDSTTQKRLVEHALVGARRELLKNDN